MYAFTDEERKYLIEMRAIRKNIDGTEVLVGLDPEETAFYMEYTKKCIAGEDNHQDTDRYIELHDKHEKARLTAIALEIELRKEDPTFH